MYEHVVHRASFASIAWKIKDYFGLPVFTPDVRAFKQLISRYYEGTYQRLREKIVGESLVHADETEVHLRREGKGYVWVWSAPQKLVHLKWESLARLCPGGADEEATDCRPGGAIAP